MTNTSATLRAAIDNVVKTFLSDYATLGLTADTLTPMIDKAEQVLPRLAMIGASSEGMANAIEPTLLATAAKLGINVHVGSLLGHRLACAIHDVVPTIAPVLRDVAAVLEDIFPDDHDAYLTSQNLLRYASTLEARQG